VAGETSQKGSHFALGRIRDVETLAPIDQRGLSAWCASSGAGSAGALAACGWSDVQQRSNLLASAATSCEAFV
jgi:hypothetical protein